MTSGASIADPHPRSGVRCRGFVETIDYPASSTFGPRRLRDYEFIWVLRGSAELEIDLTGEIGSRAGGPTDPLARIALAPGTLALSRAGTVDSYHWSPRRTSTHAWVHFEVDQPGRLPAPATWPLTRSLSDNPVLAGLCDYLVDLGARPSPTARRRTDDLVAVLLDLFVVGPLAETEPDLPPHVAAAAAYVRARWLREGVTIVEVADLADAAGVSSGHLFRAFRAAYGCGPARALELIRLSRAAVALQRSNAPLGQIAHQTGFANAYHLSRRFSLVYGLPPGGYRRRVGADDPYAPLGTAGLRQLARAVSG